MKTEQINELLYQMLETERGGVRIYETAIKCAVNDGLDKEWRKYHDETSRHVVIVENPCKMFDLDMNAATTGRAAVRHIGESLVAAMENALAAGPPEAAELVAAECVTLAETKDHLNWELVGELKKKIAGDEGAALEEAHTEVENQEDEHLYHTTGWARELWIQSLGMEAVLPPPEEQKDVKTAIGAARARQMRDEPK